MEPIVPIVENKSSSRQPARGTLADLIACVTSAAAGLIATGYSALFFFRFLENDTHFWGVASAFILCFGVGAFAYIPAAINGLISWRSYKYGATKKALIWSIALLLPWCTLGLALTFVSDIPKIYSLSMLITALLLMAWALISLQKLKPQ